MAYPSDLFDHLDTGLRDNDVDPEEWLEIVDNLWGVAATLGLGAKGSYATIQARLDALEAAVGVVGQLGHRNVRAQNDATTPLSKVALSADLLMCEGVAVENFAATVDITASGAGGLDTGAEAAAHWYFAWGGVNPLTMATTAVLSLASDRAGLTPPAGFTNWARLPGAVVRNDGGSNFWRFFSQDGNVWFADDVVLRQPTLGSPLGTPVAGNTSFASLALGGFIPPTARVVRLIGELTGTASGAATLRVRQKGNATGNGIPVCTVPATAGALVQGPVEVPTDTSQAIEWATSAAPASLGVMLYVAGFREGA